MSHFLPALTGGILIGIAVLLLMFTLGRIAGISGISFAALEQINNPSKRDSAWRWCFLIGLITGPLALGYYSDFHIPSLLTDDLNLVMLAGLLVGLGTHMGSGCTSGHGICGMSRLSIRSIVATCTFMIAGIATVYLAKHLFVII